MVNSFLLFISTATVALAVENAVLARGLGLDRHFMLLKDPREGLLLSGLFAWVIWWSALPVSLINLLLAGRSHLTMLRAPLYLAGVVAVYFLTLILSRRLIQSRELADAMEQALPLSTFNSALFSSFFLSASQNFVFAQTMGYALGTALGYAAALFIIYYARKRLAISAVPRAFRGLPILLIYLGLLSLALYGLIGHNLPT